MFLEKTEGESGLGGGSRLGDVDYTELLALKIFCQFREIVLADVVSREEDGGVLLVTYKPCERVAQSLDDGACSKVATADASNNYDLAVLTQYVGAVLYLLYEVSRD